MVNPFSILRLFFHVRRPSAISLMPVVIDTFWLRQDWQAMTFFGTIVTATHRDAQLMQEHDNSLMRHEMIHLRQAQSTHDSWLLFYLRYLWYYLRALPQNRYMKHAAYYINPFELEAYCHMDDPGYLDKCVESGAMEWRELARMTPRERLKRFYPSIQIDNRHLS